MRQCDKYMAAFSSDYNPFFCDESIQVHMRPYGKKLIQRAFAFQRHCSVYMRFIFEIIENISKTFLPPHLYKKNIDDFSSSYHKYIRV